MRTHRRYAAFPTVALPGRNWPDKTIDRAPRWLSTDLRDGNQALAEPMSPKRKAALFELLTDIGYREIEVGFPAASKDDHEFVRMLIEEDRIPDGVRISVLVPARAELVRATARSLVGAPRATMHLYNATSPLFRDIVLGTDRRACKELAVQGTREVLAQYEKLLGGTDLGFQYSPEIFNETELDFALEICEAVMDLWQPGPDREIILNFPATVERSTPNVFADQIEWMSRNLSRREHVCLSIHPHNDRGTAVAAAELAVQAGADRIEGCLFGNGERTGNVCLVTLGMNLYTQGVDPGIDFSDIARIRQVVEDCYRTPVHPRHPYGGDLVFTAFSGAHQDAIKKGLETREREAERAGTSPDDLAWNVPYLPVDPKDVGRTYETLIRVNSQSGKSGVAYAMRKWHGLNLPRGLQIDFAEPVQRRADLCGSEVGPDELWEIFVHEYSPYGEPAGSPRSEIGFTEIPAKVSLYLDGGRGDSPAAFRAIGTLLAVDGIDLRAIHRIDGGVPEPSRVVIYAECQIDGREVWGAGIAADVAAASSRAVKSAIARSSRHREHAAAERRAA